MKPSQLTSLEKAILNQLLDGLERKKSNNNRRVIMKADQFVAYDLSSYEKKHLFIQAVKSLGDKAFIDYTWVKFEKNNLLDRIILLESAVDTIYLLVGRKKKADKISDYLNEIKHYQTLITTDWINRFLDDESHYMQQKGSWSSVWAKEKSVRAEFIKLLSALEAKEEVSLRYLSVRLFGNSKRIEKRHKSRLISLAKAYLELQMDDADVLEYLGISMNPREILFCGDLEYVLGGATIQSGCYLYGTSINGSTIEHMAQLKVYNKKVVTIENKATYYEYLKVKPKEELVIYLGGFFGKTARAFLQKLSAIDHLSFYHWSDIDLGGFRIFKYLYQVLDGNVAPMAMDVQTYLTNLELNADTDDLPKQQLEAISEMKDQPEMVLLKDTIEQVLVKKKRLEQECINCDTLFDKTHS